ALNFPTCPTTYASATRLGTPSMAPSSPALIGSGRFRIACRPAMSLLRSQRSPSRARTTFWSRSTSLEGMARGRHFCLWLMPRERCAPLRWTCILAQPTTHDVWEGAQMKLPRRRLLLLTAGVAALSGVSRTSIAQTYRRLVVPFGPDSTADAVG